jgi:PAS domain S-box-containing protein
MNLKPRALLKIRPGIFPNKLLILLFGVIALGLIIGGFWFYDYQTQTIRTNKFSDLQFIAELKTNQIVQWREERLADALLISQDPSIRSSIQPLLAAPSAENLSASFLKKMRLRVELESYYTLTLTNLTGKVVLSTNPGYSSLEYETLDLVKKAVSDNGARMGDFFRSSTTNNIFLDVAAPILDEAGQVAAVIILRTKPEDYLYPLIESWPALSRTGETLLVQRYGENALFLNRLRHRADPPLTLLVPLSNLQTPAAQAVLGNLGPFSGSDYRDHPVLAQIMHIPDTPWYLIAKVDQEEILADTRTVGWIILVIVVLAILMTIALAAYLVNIQQHTLLQMLFRSEVEKRLSQEETRVTLYSIGDGVITTDREGRITRMNPTAEQLTGWTESDAMGLPSEQVFKIVNEDTRATVESPIQRVLQLGEIVGLANHTLLIARDGGEYAIADSGAPIRDANGVTSGVVLVFRDQTEERHAHQALLASEERFTKAFSANPTPMTISRLADDTIIDVNQSFSVTFGCNRAELLEKSALQFDFFVQPAQRSAILARMRETNQACTDEITMQTCGGEKLHILFSVDTISLGGINCLLSTFSDISPQKRVEEQLRRSQTDLNRAQAVARVGSWVWTLKNDLLEWSDEMYSIFGIARENFSGKIPDIIAQRVHPDDITVVEKWTMTASNQEQPAPLEYRLCLPDQSIRLVRGEFGEFIFDETGALVELSGIIQDMTAQHQANLALYASEERYRKLIELSPNAIFVNRDNQVDFVNPAALVLFGAAEAGQLLGKSPFELFHPDDHAIIAERIQQLKNGQASMPLVQEKIVRLDGTIRDVEVSESAIQGVDSSAIQVILRDITERKQTERQLNEQLYELRRWNSATLGREKRVLELKAEVNLLLAHMGQPPRYSSAAKVDLE